MAHINQPEDMHIETLNGELDASTQEAAQEYVDHLSDCGIQGYVIQESVCAWSVRWNEY